MTKIVFSILFGIISMSTYADVRQNCAEDYASEGDEAIACCENGGTWHSEANPKYCECADSSKTWKYNSRTKKGKCVTESDNDEDDEEEEEEEEQGQNCKVKLKADLKCTNGRGFTNQVSIPITQEQLTQLQAATCTQLQTQIDGLTNLEAVSTFLKEYLKSQKAIMDEIDAICATATRVVAQQTTTVSQDVINAKASLDKFFMTAESDASVWKDADGKFNTARLASDLTAGVVLGTVGGVVSGVVIKKKQVEKGFDALNCSVGGQKIAGWGDTFSVGMRR